MTSVCAALTQQQMKPGKFTHAIAVLLSSISSLFAHGAASKAEPAKTKFSKKSEKPADDRVLDVSSLGVHAGTVGRRTAPTGTALPVEKQHRDDRLLDRRETLRQQSSPQSGEFMGQAMDEKLRRDG